MFGFKFYNNGLLLKNIFFFIRKDENCLVFVYV